MKTELFLEFLSNQKEACLDRAKQLQAEERQDDAVFYKAKANIYDVYTALFNVSVKQAAGDDERMREEFLKKATAVSRKWEEALAAAKEHEAAKNILLEETKLAAVCDIMKRFEEMWER